MGLCFQKRAALVVMFTLLLLLTAEAATSGDHPSSSSMPKARKLLNFPAPTAGELPAAARGGAAGQYSTARMGPDEWKEGQDAAEQPCRRALSVEPCFHSPSYYDCAARKDVELDKVRPYIRRCEDVSWGIKLVNESGSQW